jgi:hypothetical protein
LPSLLANRFIVGRDSLGDAVHRALNRAPADGHPLYDFAMTPVH